MCSNPINWVLTYHWIKFRCDLIQGHWTVWKSKCCTILSMLSLEVCERLCQSKSKLESGVLRHKDLWYVLPVKWQMLSLQSSPFTSNYLFIQSLFAPSFLALPFTPSSLLSRSSSCILNQCFILHPWPRFLQLPYFFPSLVIFASLSLSAPSTTQQPLFSASSFSAHYTHTHNLVLDYSMLSSSPLCRLVFLYSGSQAGDGCRQALVEAVSTRFKGICQHEVVIIKQWLYEQCLVFDEQEM